MSELLPFHFAKRHGVFVEAVSEAGVVIAHRDALTPLLLQELRRYCKKPLKLKAIEADAFETHLARAYEMGADAAMAAMSGIEDDLDLTHLIAQLPTSEDLLESQDDAPVIRLINAILTQAIKQSASDVHVEIFEDKLVVRYRIDGVLREVIQPPRVLAPMLTSRLKVMAKLNIAEKRLPQDGRITLRLAGRAVDVRISTIPTHYGERIVLRLLDKQSAPLDLKRLGMSEETVVTMQRLIQSPHGIILVTGPTGSGKTTALYAALTALNDETRNILTVEDPIEYYLAGIGQTQVNHKVDMTFARGLRAILRQDPDVVMVGEIRDLETVEVAIQASLTGHLVLSTLHTNSAIGAITRLRDMGAESFLLSSTIIGVAAQRLVRTLCGACKKTSSASEAEKNLLGVTGNVTVYRPNGCVDCANLGYVGRTGIYELITIDDTLRTMIHDNHNESDLEKQARLKSPSIRQDGWRRVLAGDTSIEEVLRVTTEVR